MDKNVNIPKVTVIMPVHNGEKYLEEAVLSILRQSFSDFELLITNDCSTDSTLDLLYKLTNGDQRVRIINNTINIGAASSSNNMIKEARGKYIARMDADDISHQDRLKVEFDFLEANKDYVLVGSYTDIISKDGKYISTLKYPVRDWKLRAKMTRSNQFVHGSVMYRTDIVKKLGGYNTENKQDGDYHLWFKMMKEGKVSTIPQTLYSWRSPDLYSADKIAYQDAKREYQNKMDEEIRKTATRTLKYLPENFLYYVWRISNIKSLFKK